MQSEHLLFRNSFVWVSVYRPKFKEESKSSPYFKLFKRFGVEQCFPKPNLKIFYYWLKLLFQAIHNLDCLHQASSALEYSKKQISFWFKFIIEKSLIRWKNHPRKLTPWNFSQTMMRVSSLQENLKWHCYYGSHNFHRNLGVSYRNN